MSMRPIDFQVTIPRSTEVARINNLNQRPDAAQQAFSQEFQKKVAEENRNVHQAAKSEYNKVDKDGRNNQSGGKGKKQKKKKEAKPSPKEGTSLYDIRI